MIEKIQMNFFHKIDLSFTEIYWCIKIYDRKIIFFIGFYDLIITFKAFYYLLSTFKAFYGLKYFHLQSKKIVCFLLF